MCAFLESEVFLNVTSHVELRYAVGLPIKTPNAWTEIQLEFC